MVVGRTDAVEQLRGEDIVGRHPRAVEPRSLNSQRGPVQTGVSPHGEFFEKVRPLFAGHLRGARRSGQRLRRSPDSSDEIRRRPPSDHAGSDGGAVDEFGVQRATKGETQLNPRRQVGSRQLGRPRQALFREARQRRMLFPPRAEQRQGDPLLFEVLECAEAIKRRRDLRQELLVKSAWIGFARRTQCIAKCLEQLTRRGGDLRCERADARRRG